MHHEHQQQSGGQSIDFRRDPNTGQFLSEEEAARLRRYAQRHPQEVRRAYQRDQPIPGLSYAERGDNRPSGRAGGHQQNAQGHVQQGGQGSRRGGGHQSQQAGGGHQSQQGQQQATPQQGQQTQQRTAQQQGRRTQQQGHQRQPTHQQSYQLQPTQQGGQHGRQVQQSPAQQQTPQQQGHQQTHRGHQQRGGQHGHQQRGHQGQQRQQRGGAERGQSGQQSGRNLPPEAQKLRQQYPTFWTEDTDAQPQRMPSDEEIDRMEHLQQQVGGYDSERQTPAYRQSQSEIMEERHSGGGGDVDQPDREQLHRASSEMSRQEWERHQRQSDE